MKLFLLRISLAAFLFLFLNSFFVVKGYIGIDKRQKSSDSTSLGYLPQMHIDSLEKIILSVAQAEYELAVSRNSLDALDDSLKLTEQASTETRKRKKLLLTDFQNSADTTAISYEKFENDLSGNRDSLKLFETRIENIKKRIPELKSAHAKSQKKFDALRNNESKRIEDYLGRNLAKTKNGAAARYFFGKRCRFFIADTSYLIKIHHNSGKAVGLESIITQEKGRVDMVTNAGMFTPEFKPQGLLISEGVEKVPVDSTKRNDGNFYMLPNGVFFIDSLNGFHIGETKEFIKQKTGFGKAKSVSYIKYATQSGPMLVKGGTIHKAFNLSSINLNVRSGVGVMKDGRVIFIIADDVINFYQFALIFRDFFLCKEALYLDGAISKMYTKEESLYAGQKFENGKGGSFGPMISVTEKK